MKFFGFDYLLRSADLYEPFQSGFSETSLIKNTNDLLIAADSGHISILILLDLSAAFDTVSYTIRLTAYLTTLISPFQLSPGFTHRKQFVTSTKSSFTPVPVNQGVPQGSLLGPQEFSC